MGREEEPASPSARLMQAKEFNLCIIALLGYNSTIDPNLYKKNVEQALPKHPRFSSILMKKKGKCWWKRTRNIDIDKHVIMVGDLDPNMESSDKFVEDFASDLSKIPMDMTKPLWEFHILNVTTSDAKAVVIFKIHHSMGDGVSLIALIQACSTKISHPHESLPHLMPSSNKETHLISDKAGFMMRFIVLIWTIIRVIVNTIADCALFLATIMFLKDGDTPIKAPRGSVLPYKRFVHTIVNFNDVKFVKTVMNVTINDVLVGATEAGLSRYLNTTYEKHVEIGENITQKRTNSLPRNLRLRSAIVFNLRPSPTVENLIEMMENEELSEMWGNKVGIVLLPFTIALQDDPLTHILRAKSNMDRKKLSLGHKSVYLILKLMMFLFGAKIAAGVTGAIFKNTTLTLSNVMGPRDEVNLFGHPLSYIAPSICGFPQSLIVHYQSYAEKLIISIGADEKLIPNPHQLCDDLVKSLVNIKEAVIKRSGLLNASDHLC